MNAAVGTAGPLPDAFMARTRARVRATQAEPVHVDLCRRRGGRPGDPAVRRLARRRVSGDRLAAVGRGRRERHARRWHRTRRRSACAATTAPTPRPRRERGPMVVRAPRSGSLSSWVWSWLSSRPRRHTLFRPSAGTRSVKPQRLPRSTTCRSPRRPAHTTTRRPHAEPPRRVTRTDRPASPSGPRISKYSRLGPASALPESPTNPTSSPAATVAPASIPPASRQPGRRRRRR